MLWRSTCLGQIGRSSANAVAVTASGSVIIAGSTNSSKFPLTPGSFQTDCNCSYIHATSFVSNLTEDGRMIWSTYLGGTGGILGRVDDTASRLQIAQDGAVIVAGLATSPDFPVTAGAFQSKLRTSNGQGLRPNVFLSKLSASGNALVASTFLGGSTGETLSGLALDPRQNIYVGGITQSADFPLLPGSLVLGNNFAVELNAALTAEVTTALFPNGSIDTDFTLDPDGKEVLLGRTGSLLRVPSGPITGPAVFAVTNAAGFIVSGHVAPGEVISIYGVGLGPDLPAGAQLDSAGRVSSSIGGVRVEFDGVAAPLFYAGPNQIHAVVPFEVAPRSVTEMRVVPSQIPPSVRMRVTSSNPEIVSIYDRFALSPAAVALNSDGQLNGTSNPAKAGSFITFYVFGSGLFTRAFANGKITGSDLANSASPVTVLVDDQAATVLYAGSAPSIVAGVMQVNAVVPSSLAGRASHTLQVQVGGASSSLVSIGVVK